MMRKRAVLTGAAVGFALGMPLFEISLLTMLAVDGELFRAVHVIRYFSSSANIIALLVALHVATAAIGALVGALSYRNRRRHLRVIPGRMP